MEEEIIKSANDTMMQLHNEVMQLNKRIDKAIEYLNGYKEYLKRLDEQGAYYSTIEVRMCDEMIHILKGTDKE